MDERKRTRYLNITKEVIGHLGGQENLTGVAHCATRLRVVLKDNEKANLEAIDNVDLVKGVFLAGDQVQIIFGSGLVNDVYEVFANYTGMKGQSLSDLKTEANQKMNPLQRILKGLSDVFIDIMPGILAAALLTVLPELLRAVNDYRMLLYAVLLIAMMLFNNSKLKQRLLARRQKEVE